MMGMCMIVVKDFSPDAWRRMSLVPAAERHLMVEKMSTLSVHPEWLSMR